MRTRAICLFGLLLLGLATPALAVELKFGDILVTDSSAFGGSGGVVKVDPVTGAQTAVSSGGFFVDPARLALEATGKILVVDQNAFGGSGGVIRVDPATGAQTVVSSGGFFVDPTDIALTETGQILVADPNAFGGGGGIIKVDPVTGAQTALAFGGFFASDPQGRAVVPVPEPGTVLLLGSGLAGMGAGGWWKRRKTGGAEG